MTPYTSVYYVLWEKKIKIKCIWVLELHQNQPQYFTDMIKLLKYLWHSFMYLIGAQLWIGLQLFLVPQNLVLEIPDLKVCE